MRYYLDTEFNGHDGDLLSIGLVSEDLQKHFYGIREYRRIAVHPWVKENVYPVLKSVPSFVDTAYFADSPSLGKAIAKFLENDSDPVIITDWPEDIAYFCKALITSPGWMVDIRALKFEMYCVNAYPTALADAVQHNAWWDAMALRHVLYAVLNT
jgi:hypothetical protein